MVKETTTNISQYLAYIKLGSEAYLCMGCDTEYVIDEDFSFESLDTFVQMHQGKFLLTVLSYDLKNRIEHLQSSNPLRINTPEMVLFVPQSVYEINGQHYKWVFGEKNDDQVAEIMAVEAKKNVSIKLQAEITKGQYIEQINRAKEQIQQGNCYELNFCMNFHGQMNQPFATWPAFRYLDFHSQAPHACYLSYKHLTMMGSSPERFIKKTDKKLISQPIKGTRPRKQDPDQDAAMIQELQNDIKERAENIMIVDLVRNDLTKVSQTGTIRVNELCGIYSFPGVHQMISTISSELKEKVTFKDIIKALFPMGSMTGAPKISAMKIIDELESFQRGWYSGSVGLIFPNGDFDLNVVIRTLIYDKSSGYICCPVGGAITALSDPAKEYDECLVKINKIQELFA